ncbi:hypothetical protein [Deinococcus sp. QL22]|uniref:hypothetical protein n=1 Tax=Deinococcus sp. QL22 TaxID=2939437 RepID=UPI0020181C54|nr:hypothetical protein [Deinococcus sp. QL22]UQN08210.1 hypothetical protein M1R55_19220 [Deinococcus sp. QL22]
MNVFPAVLMGSACALSVVTLLLLFTGNLLAMTATAVAAILLAALAIPNLDQQEQAEHTRPLDD